MKYYLSKKNLTRDKNYEIRNNKKLLTKIFFKRMFVFNLKNKIIFISDKVEIFLITW